jgi:hypothetical protein
MKIRFSNIKVKIKKASRRKYIYIYIYIYIYLRENGREMKVEIGESVTASQGNLER